VLGSSLFLGGYAWPAAKSAPFFVQLVITFIKASAIIMSMFWFRASLPRMRVDQLMSFAWKVLIPISFVQLFIDGWILVYSPPGWGLWIAIPSWLLTALLFWATKVGIERLGRRRPKEERLEQIRQLTAARSA
jgi:uncharacterized membrane protein YciS (DUF1049 family)